MKYVFITNGDQELNRKLQKKLFELGADWRGTYKGTDLYAVAVFLRGNVMTEVSTNCDLDKAKSEFEVLNPHDIISGELIPEGLAYKPRFWSNRKGDIVWWTCDGKDFYAATFDELCVGMVDAGNDTATFTKEETPRTQQEAEDFLNADFDGTKFIKREAVRFYRNETYIQWYKGDLKSNYRYISSGSTGTFDIGQSEQQIAKAYDKITQEQAEAITGFKYSLEDNDFIRTETMKQKDIKRLSQDKMYPFGMLDEKDQRLLKQAQNDGMLLECWQSIGRWSEADYKISFSNCKSSSYRIAPNQPKQKTTLTMDEISKMSGIPVEKLQIEKGK
jgi:hypothetical protein